MVPAALIYLSPSQMRPGSGRVGVLQRARSENVPLPGVWPEGRNPLPVQSPRCEQSRSGTPVQSHGARPDHRPSGTQQDNGYHVK